MLAVTIIAIVALVIVGIPLGFSIIGGVMLGFALQESRRNYRRCPAPSSTASISRHSSRCRCSSSRAL